LRDSSAERPSPRRRTRLVPLVGLSLLALLLAACGGDATQTPQNALNPAGRFAQDPHDLISIVLIIAAVVFVLVHVLIIWSVVKYRQRKDDDGSLPVQVHGNTRLEIFWTIIPALSQMDEPDDAFVVEVIGHRWWFEYYYPEYDIYTANEMVIPTERPVRLQMTSSDPARDPSQGVIHSFWVPRLAGKQDLVPGQSTFLNLEADEPGRYYGQCAEYCGLSHVNMRIRVDALAQTEFDAWVEAQTTPAEAPTDELAARGRELFGDLGDRQACAACHQVWEGDSGRTPGTGPDLTHLMSREEFAGAIHDLTPENLREWLRDPNSMKSMQYEVNGIGMPNLDLTDEELDALVAYLLTLE
jgi:cytochrome c oxidase subunit II